MSATMVRRMLTEPDKRLLWKFVYNFGYKGMRAVEKFKKRLKRGEYFPAFLFLSVTNACNLTCQGCHFLNLNSLLVHRKKQSSAC